MPISQTVCACVCLLMPEVHLEPQIEGNAGTGERAVQHPSPPDSVMVKVSTLLLYVNTDGLMERFV